MKTYLQYFNCEKMGRFPNGAEALLAKRMGVFTKLPSVKDSKGGTVFVVTGLGKPKRYYLWESFTIEEIEHDGEQYTISGPGWVLLPPALLEGKDFDKFKAACANFIGFRAIDDLPYHKTLRKLADKHRRDDVSATCEGFCGTLIETLPKNGDAYYYRGTVRKRLGKVDAAKEDFGKALALGTNFPNEAQAAMTDAAPAKAKAGKGGMAVQVTAKGLFAQQGAVKKPAGVSEVAWRGVLLRRGAEDLRQKLLLAYGGRCAVTGYDTAEALEVALIEGDAASGPFEVANALLLRGDVRTLFELNLLRVDPRTKKVFLADELKKTRYARYWARRLRLPANKDDWPGAEALARRWEAGER